jgi:hypothetical protein
VENILILDTNVLATIVLRNPPSDYLNIIKAFFTPNNERYLLPSVIFTEFGNLLKSAGGVSFSYQIKLDYYTDPKFTYFRITKQDTELAFDIEKRNPTTRLVKTRTFNKTIRCDGLPNQSTQVKTYYGIGQADAEIIACSKRLAPLLRKKQLNLINITGDEDFHHALLHEGLNFVYLFYDDCGNVITY